MRTTISWEATLTTIATPFNTRFAALSSIPCLSLSAFRPPPPPLRSSSSPIFHLPMVAFPLAQPQPFAPFGRLRLLFVPFRRRCVLKLLLSVLLLLLLLRLLISPNSDSLPITRDVFIYASFLYKNTTTSLSASARDSVAVLFLANRNDNFPYLRCALSNGSSTRPMPPAQLFHLDYVAVCELVIFVAWCNFPPNSFPANAQKVFVDLGTQVLADQSLRERYTRPILHQIHVQKANETPRKLVMCISRIFAFEKWELLIVAMEVYKRLGVDLVVTHVYSALTPVFELIRAYETEGRLAIRKGVKLPFLRHLMNFDPDRQLEYSGQLAMVHECFYEFRQSASFISLVDWDDLLITTNFPSLPDAFFAAAQKYPNSAYFLVNKLESGIHKRAVQNRSPANFRLENLLQNSVFTKRAYNSEKMISGTEMAYKENVLSALWHSPNASEKANAFFANKTVGRIMRSLPSRLYYFASIRHCSLFLNAYPDLFPPPPCLSYSLCSFPQISVPCTVAKTHFHTTSIEPTRVYRVHVRQWSRFEKRSQGCFDSK
ncbi:hypothetical protein niasHS_010702 [Heterodera schachtii]|uniref:Glycosyltransferase family 92 protein n=1 Tax=Heterodera schachtii TaxID=97005 RepID=A0ABD2IZ24_HETSC